MGRAWNGIAWNVDARTRSHTRGVLMALSRDRTWYFIHSLPNSVVVGLLTFGLVPMLDAPRRFDRWRRLEWVQHAEVMRWIGDRTGDPSAHALAADAEAFAGRPSLQAVTRMIVFLALGLAAWAAYDGGFWGLLQTVFWPASLRWTAAAYVGLLTIGWIAHLAAVLRHQARVAMWLAVVNDVMADHERRPILPAMTPLPRAAIMAGAVIGVFGPTWLGMQVVALSLQNRYIRSTRAARLRFVERMLEWMDAAPGGRELPMEYDVEELNPDQIAAAIA